MNKMRVPAGCMVQIHEALWRAVNSKSVLRKKWKAFLYTDGYENKKVVALFHYHHLVMVYDLESDVEVFAWHERQADKRGLVSARVWFEKYKEFRGLTERSTFCNREV